MYSPEFNHVDEQEARDFVAAVAAGTLVGDTFVADDASVDAFHRVIVICAALLAAGGAVGALGIANPRRVVEARRCAGGQLVGVPGPAADVSPARAGQRAM